MRLIGVMEYTRECLAIGVAGSIRSGRVIEVLSKLISVRGAPRHLRSDNGPEFINGKFREPEHPDAGGVRYEDLSRELQRCSRVSPANRRAGQYGPVVGVESGAWVIALYERDP